MKKLILLFMFLLLIGNVSAGILTEWNDKLDYKDNNLTVVITNWWGLGEKIGEATLTSHKTFDEIRKVPQGRNISVMHYDFPDWTNYKDGLGEVYLTDLDTGEEIIRPYYFGKAVYKDISRYGGEEVNCSQVKNVNGTFIEKCEYKSVLTDIKKTIVGWDILETTDIPGDTGDNTIGLILDVRPGDRIDGVWTILGKKVKLHAGWDADLNTDLFAYFNWSWSNDTSGNGNHIYMDDAPVFGSGKVGNDGDWERDTTDWASNTTTTSYLPTLPFSGNLWWKPEADGLGAYQTILSKSADGTGGWRFEVFQNADNTMGVRVTRADGTHAQVNSISIFGSGDYSMLSWIADGTDLRVYVNATEEGTPVSLTDLRNNSPASLRVCRKYGSPTSYCDGHFDEWSLHTRSILADLEDLWNGGAGTTHSLGPFDSGAGNVTMNSPLNQTYSATTTLFNITFNDDIGEEGCNGTINNGASNFTLVNVTTSPNDYTLENITMSEGSFEVKYFCMDVNGNENNSESQSFRIALAPSVILNSPVNNTNISVTDLNFNCSAVRTGGGVTQLDLIIDDIVNYSVVNASADVNLSLEINISGLGDGVHDWTCNASDGIVSVNSTGSLRTFLIDSTASVINVSSPRGYINYHVSGSNLTINWSVSDPHLDSCWFNYNSTNTSLTCADNNYTFTTNSQQNLTFYSNDTYGNEGSNFTEWVYIIKEITETFSNSTVEGNTETFTINITINSTTFPNSRASLVYNGTSNTGTKIGSGDSLLFTRNLLIPNVDAQVNLTFYWEIVLNNGTDNPFNSTFHNQSVSELSVDNCTTNTNVLYNFTIVDERSQIFLNPTNQNTSGKLNLQVFTLDRSIEVINFTKFYNKTNPFQVCLSSNLSGANFSVDAEIEYSADDYTQEFYHIQNDTLNEQDLHTNITLFDLDSTNAQEFKVIYKDQSFLPVAGVLIQVQRKYVDEGVFKTVEIPKTDFAGATVANLELNDVKYTFIIIKNGELLATFADKFPVCDNAGIDDCEINLNSFGSSAGLQDFTQLEDFSFSLDYNRTSRIITSIFSIPSGTQSEVSLNATLFDGLGNRSVCDDILTSSSGTLTCAVPSTFGNGSVVVTIEKDGVKVGGGTTSLAQSSVDVYGSNLAFLSIFILLTLIGIGISSSPMITGVFIAIGIILNITLNLMDTGVNSFIGAGATILWLFIAIVIVLIKGAKRI
ncbi:hypothetical protein CMI47_14085 [Candidatus Pacearchaeota archaeon]|nr:hypothetical protein [Candidatus Pacearchaeota archaeon]